MNRLPQSILVTLLVLSLPLSASAQTPDKTFQVEHFEVMHDLDTNILNVARSQVLGHLDLSAGLMFHYADSPLVVREGETTQDLIEQQFKGEIWFALGLFEYLDFGAVLPVVFYQTGGDIEATPGEEDRTATIGDIRFNAKFRFLKPEWAAGFGAGAVVTTYIPSGDTKSFNSDGAFRVEPRLVIDWTHDVGLAANIGYQVRPERSIFGYASDDRIRWAAATLIPTGYEPLRLYGDIFGSLQATDPGPEWGKGPGEPIEVLGGVQVDFPQGITMNLGGGAGLSTGVGSPDYRALIAFGYSPPEGDRDRDGIRDNRDRCPDEPEDIDGDADDDGCPDDDRDGDGIPDREDNCPERAEDLDGFQDSDGCPENDNDGDGIPDREDRCPETAGTRAEEGCPKADRDGDGILDGDDLCPDEKEDRDNFDDDDGCPDLDNDFDGVPDANDRCPDKVEDMDGFQDDDGCPDEDNDGDGIPDSTDNCPNERETFNDYRDDDGCPDEKKSAVSVTKDKLVITEKIYFSSGSDRIQSRSFNILEEIAKTLKANPQIKRLRVEGHTDSRGADDKNEALSQRRADSVRKFLIGEGIEPDRLEARGYGEARPISDNDTSQGRERNRRVEFTIIN